MCEQHTGADNADEDVSAPACCSKEQQAMGNTMTVATTVDRQWGMGLQLEGAEPVAGRQRLRDLGHLDLELAH
jgi:hypothetical protein